MVYTVPQVISKLKETYQLVAECKQLTNAHKGYLEKTVKLLAEDEKSSGKLSRKNQTYLEFLKQVFQISGLDSMILCAAALGVSYVYAMGLKSRLQLPQRLNSEVLPSEFIEVAASHRESFSKFFRPNHIHQQAVSTALSQPASSSQLAPTQIEASQLTRDQLCENQSSGLGTFQESCKLSWPEVGNSLNSHTAPGVAPVLLSTPGGIPFVAFPVTWDAATYFLATTRPQT